MSTDAARLPVVVVGAGPVGLAAAAHLLARGIEPLVLEAGDRVGASVARWAHVKMFSPWTYDVDRASRALLEANGWKAPCGTGHPTGADLVTRYLEPLAATPELSTRIRLGQRVVAVARVGVGKVKSLGRDTRPFEVHASDAQGNEIVFLARAVIDASGSWEQPNPAGASGLPAAGERAASSHVRYGMPDVLGADCSRYAGRRTLVVGSGHSAIGTLLDLAQLAEAGAATQVAWALRKRSAAAAYGGGNADQLPERGALGARLKALVDAGRITALPSFDLERIERGADGALTVTSIAGASAIVEELGVATGFRPALDLLRELRLSLDPALECPAALAPLIDPNVHSCGTVRPHGAIELSHPENGFFIAGMKSYGRAPTFLLATGYEQARSIAAYIAGDVAAAQRVELALPETGVCSSKPIAEEAAIAPVQAKACCGVAA
ncbi:MAG: flavoprotein [Rhodospirillales bacterium]|nr:flavoprotein [Rhodospirillales bacterium]